MVLEQYLGGARCAACGRHAPAGPAVVASVAGLAVAYLCADCPPWDEGEQFRAFEAAVCGRYAGLPVRFAFWPQSGERHPSDGAPGPIARPGRAAH
jgi:hypothetical protein